jgi:hypothetical protein
MCVALFPIAEPFRWVCVVLAVAYALLAVASHLDARTRRLSEPTPRTSGDEASGGRTGSDVS